MTASPIKRVILMVLDSVGVGALPDAGNYGDEGANTLLHVAQARGGLCLPTLARLGLGRILPLPGVEAEDAPLASWGSMHEASQGKDTIAGHWEMMGIILKRPFALFPQGFPDGLLVDFMGQAGVQGVLGNRSASGTVIIQELGDEHVSSGFPIVYTSADSVFQIAAHEEVIPPPRLYEICKAARKLCDPHQIGRVIARPFVGGGGEYSRTPGRKDFPMEPTTKTALDLLKAKGLPVVGIGKIENIFAGKGITRSLPTESNGQGMEVLEKELAITETGLIFINLIDFDMLYGHRNDVEGYASALEACDQALASLLPRLGRDDLLIITADHGCDPTHSGTDHTREAVPLLAYSPAIPARDLGIRSTFSDLGATLLSLFRAKGDLPGEPLFETSKKGA